MICLALFSFVVAALSVQQAVSHPVRRNLEQPGVNDIVILQFALGLEHLESAFYNIGLEMFDNVTFESAGFSPEIRGRYEQIAGHEATHVQTLSTVLGNNTILPCNYSFPFTDVRSWVSLSQIFEGVGTSAYTGAAPFVSNPAYLAVAGSIVTTEARQATWVASVVNAFAPWGSPFETPITFSQATTLASAFIVSCPSTNPVIPFTTFPTLNLTNTGPGQNATVQVSGSVTPTFVAFLNGLNTTFVPVVNGNVTIPKGLLGQVYAIATSSGTTLSDNTTVAGPAILEFNFDAQGTPIGNILT